MNFTLSGGWLLASGYTIPDPGIMMSLSLDRPLAGKRTQSSAPSFRFRFVPGGTCSFRETMDGQFQYALPLLLRWSPAGGVTQPGNSPWPLPLKSTRAFTPTASAA
jgi:hypothetical protein